MVMLIRLFNWLNDLTQSRVLHLLSDRGQREIEKLYRPLEAANGGAGRKPESAPAELGPPTQTRVYEGPPLYIVGFDVVRLVGLARRHDATIRIPFSRGDAINDGMALVFVYGGDGALSEAALRTAIAIHPDRTLEDDPKYALRLLVDIAARALSPSVIDPTTAVHSLDHIEALLVRLGRSDLDVGRVRDASGALRFVYDATTWEEYLELGVAEIQQYGADSIQVERRLVALFELLRTRVPPWRLDAIERLARRQRATAEAAFPTGESRVQVELGDRQGLGHG
jgi:uncharacterized membrane protein